MKRHKGNGAKRPRPKKSAAVIGLVSTRGIAEHLKMSERQLHILIGRGLPVAVRGKGRASSYFRLADVERWLTEHGAQGGESDFLDPNQTSPWLEKYREERYRREKRQNDIAEGRLFEIKAVRNALQEIFGRLRAELEAVGRAYGPAVADQIREAIERAEQGGHAKFPEPEIAPGEAATAAPAAVEAAPAIPPVEEAKAP
jgi:phage terminase Nu1 subunit (DNA packaging protein)